MIFITVGSQAFPFDRLLQIIDEAIINAKIETDIFAQIGEAKYIPKSFPYAKFLQFDDMIDYIKKSDIIIAHAGVGTVVLCLNLGKIPIIVPRRAELNEHIDNHQIEFVERLKSENRVLIADNNEDILYKIKNYYTLIKHLNKNISFQSKLNLIEYLNTISDI